MSDRFQISKVNGGDFEPSNITTISEHASDNNNATTNGNPPQTVHHYQQNAQPRRSSRLSFRGFGSFLRTKQNDEDRKFSLAQITQ